MIPSTSTTLLRQISGDVRHARWAEFIARYSPMCRQYLRRQFPSLEADDILQETFAALDVTRNADASGTSLSLVDGHVAFVRAVRHRHWRRNVVVSVVSTVLCAAIVLATLGRAVAPRPPSGRDGSPSRPLSEEHSIVARERDAWTAPRPSRRQRVTGP